MKTSYSHHELDSLLATVSRRVGWDFTRMNDSRAPTTWDYRTIVAKHLKPSYDVLDIGTGGGEMLLTFASSMRSGLGIDLDPEMIAAATENGLATPNVCFRQGSHRLDGISERFDVALNRHAPFVLEAISTCLKPDGVFITQQVGERNMSNIKDALDQNVPTPITPALFDDVPLDLIDFREYDVEYVVSDVESLVFWLSALDVLHADVDGAVAISDVDVFNTILNGNVTERGFITNEHRYLAVARKTG